MPEALMGSRPARDPGVRLGPGLWRGAVLRHVVKSASGRKYEVGATEFFVLSQLDGVRTLAEIGADV
jgi:putative peptide zinc metalloprotease protein